MNPHPGMPVLLAPSIRRGGLPSYAMVIRALTPATAAVVITATSGGRARGDVLNMPQTMLKRRPRGRHRRPRPARPWWRVW